jgi:pyruvate dehydrogenase E1 component
MASMIPNCISYDPTYAYEMSTIIENGIKRMHTNKENIFYYITALNENYKHPEIPSHVKKEDILKGMYLFKEFKNKGKANVQLFGSGSILNETIKAAEILSKDFGIDSDVWSITSYSEIQREGAEILRWNQLHPDKKPKKTYIEKCLDGKPGPIIAASDYIRSHVDQVRPYIKNNLYTLGTDGYGRSDTRKELRKFFEVNKESIVVNTLSALSHEQKIASKVVNDAIKKYKIDPEKPYPIKL